MLDLYEWCKEQRKQAQSRLKDLQSGRWTIGEYVNGELVDQTQQSIDTCHREITQMDELIAAYEKRKA